MYKKNSKILKKLSDKLSVPDQWNSFDLLPRECKFSENSVSKKMYYLGLTPSTGWNRRCSSTQGYIKILKLYESLHL
jgi:hypothetical protein